MNNTNPWGDVVLPSRPEYRFSAMWLTFLLALLNIGMYIWQVNFASPLTDPVYNILLAGGSVYQFSLTGDWWRYATSILLHSDPVHLGINTIALLVFGINCEALTGKVRMLFIYLFTGIAASLTSALWQSAQSDMSPLSGISVIVGVGASGAIMGLAGATVMYLIRARNDPSVSVADSLRYKNLLITMIVLIVLSLLSALQSDDEVMTDDVAHFSGLICGAVPGWLYSAASGVRNRKMDRRSWLISAAATGLLVLLLFTCSSSREQRLLYEREIILEEIGIMVDAQTEKQLND
ncbi:rhomboid family intramembrane serine protease [Morganella morganii]|uniref:Rhomboid family intramembrane serine protease n=1 Tax=Morganella morganii TaxID=582 RepID=A0A433ZVT6_MORMO|nr:rhomboid family intramembrane serine protease [Morganella morganii]RUT66217.1 rhomboid family intramembrane serine protease [Morganella morganii]